MIERTTPVMPNNLAKNLVIPFPPVTFATVKKSDNGIVVTANNNPIFSIILFKIHLIV
jgi:hypothetical protein